MLIFLRRTDKSLLYFSFILLTFIVCGRILGWSALKVPAPIPEGSPVLCDGMIKGGPVAAGKGWQFDAALEGCGAGTARLFTPELVAPLERGDRVRFLARFREPRAFKNPGSFNYPFYLKTRGIDYTGSLAGPKWIVKTGEGRIGLPSRVIGSAQLSINNAIEASAQGDVAGLLRAIAVGKRDGISEGLRDAFARTGVAHLLAISGLHVGYVALIVFLAIRLICGFIPRLALLWPVQRIAAAASIPFVWFYIAVAGFPISAVRAGIMLTVFLFSLFFLWRRDLLSALATAVFAILLVMPASLFSASFQLSVVSVFAIIVAAPVIIKKFDGRARHTSSIVAVTLAATLGSAPLVAYYFHFTSAVGLFSNIVAVPFAGVVLMPLVMTASALTLIYAPAAFYLWKAAAAAAAVLIKFVLFLDVHAGVAVFSWAPSVTELLFAYAAIATVVFWGRLSYRKAVAGALAAFLMCDVAYWHLGPVVNGNLEVTVFDVGHGDSILIRFPDNHVTLIDGGGIKGGDFDIGRNVLSPAILRMGIHRIDEMILTHPHHDHFKGLAAVAEHFGPRILYTNSATVPEDERVDWGEFVSRVSGAGVFMKAVSDLTLEQGGAKLTVVAPRVKDINALDPNDASLVVRLKYKNRSILLTGDLMEVGEKALIENGAELASDVLKVGHHGSETSTSEEFLKVVRPRIAVISVAERDRYGVPDRVVINRLNEAGAKIYRTDIDGAVTIRTDGDSLAVRTFIDRKL